MLAEIDDYTVQSLLWLKSPFRKVLAPNLGSEKEGQIQQIPAAIPFTLKIVKSIANFAAFDSNSGKNVFQNAADQNKR